MGRLARIDASDLDPRLAEVQVEVAADVDNRAAPMAPRRSLARRRAQAPRRWALRPGAFADLCAQLLGDDVREFPGCGAAGGMGFAAKAFMGAQFRPGVEVVAELAGLDALVQGRIW